MHLQENTVFDLGVNATGNVVQYALRHVTYTSANFEAAISNSLGGDAFTQNNDRGSWDIKW